MLSESGCEDVYSTVVTVNVTPDISISAQPVGGSICTGGNFDLSVIASGSPNIHYQWQYFDGTDWVDTGLDQADYNTGTLTDTTTYWVHIYANESGCEDVYSTVVTVNVTPDISISAQPVGGSICTGGNFDLSVIASGSPNIHYQWQYFDGTDWVDTGLDQADYNTGILTDTTTYWVHIYANESGCEDVYSTVVTVNVTPDISISAQPVGGSICTGGNFDLSVIASGSPNIHYQWQYFDGTDWVDTGLDQADYNTGVLTDTTTYWVHIYANESGCEDVYSTVVTVNVTPDISISAQPVGGSICTGGNFDLSVIASGSPNIHYQWQYFDGTDWVDTGLDQADYNTGTLTDTTEYWVHGLCQMKVDVKISIPEIVTVNVTPDISITTQPIGGSICTGGNFDLSVTASGSPDIQYLWQYFDGADWVDTGLGLADYNTGPLTDTTEYRVLVYSDESGCEDQYSEIVSVNVTPDISISAQPIGGTICTGGSFDLNVTAIGSPDIHYQWQYFNGSTWTNVGSDVPNYNTGVLTQTRDYRVWVNADENGCEDVYSANATVNVLPDATVGITADHSTVCLGGSASIISVVSGGSPYIMYQWYAAPTNSGIWSVIPGANSGTYVVPSDSVGSTWYRVSLTDTLPGCADPNSPSVVVNVLADPVITLLPLNDIYCYGETMTLSATVSGGNGTTHYHWQYHSGSNWVNTGPDSPNYNPGILAPGNYQYRLMVTQGTGCDAMSSNIVFAVLAYPQATLDSSPASCGDNEGTITMAFNDNPFTSEIMFSVDNGSTYMEAVPDTIGAITYTGFAPGTYGVWAKWAPDECPVFIGNVDVIELACGSICGNVSEDTGIPIANVKLRLYKDLNNNDEYDMGEPVVDSIFSEANTGDYCFENIPFGEYVIAEVQPENYYSVSDYDHSTNAPDTDGYASVNDPDDEIPVTLTPGESDNDNDFIEDPFQGSVSGYVRDDINNPLTGVEIELYNDPDGDGNADGTPLASLFTGGAGDFLFSGLEPGNYVVVEITPLHYSSISDFDSSTAFPDTDGNDSIQGPDDNIPVVLLPGESDEDNDFIDGRPGSICGNVSDNNGLPLSGVQIILYLDANNNESLDMADPAIDTVLTDSPGGNYCFNEVMTGNYLVVETTPLYYNSISDYDHTTAPPDTDGNDSIEGPDDNIPVILLPGEPDADNDFIDGRPGTICGNVSDSGGLPLSSVEIKLYLDVNNNDTLDVADVWVATTYTDGDTGDYCFEDVTPDEYVVKETQPISYYSVSDYDHTTSASDPDGGIMAWDPNDQIQVTLEPDEADMDNDFIEAPYSGSITGNVQDDSGTPLVDIQLNLYMDTNNDGNPDGLSIGSAFTNSSGNYTFSGVNPGHYVVVEMSPLYYSNVSDYDHTTAPPDTDGDDSAEGPDDNIPVFLLPGETDADNDFVDGRPGVICGNVSDDNGLYISSVEIRIYVDVNNNGTHDAGDILYSTTYTNGDTGDFVFEDVTPGNYVIVEIQPANFTNVSDYDHTTAPPDTDGDDSADGWDNEIPVTLMPAENDCGNDFIEDPIPGTITGRVEDETGGALDSVIISLYNDTNADGNPDGAPISVTMTNGSGNYTFTGVEPGLYVLVETTPAGYSNISDYDHSTAPPDTDGNDSALGANDYIPVKITPNETDADNIFVDGTPGLICGSVHDDTGLPVADVEVRLYEDVNNNDSLDVADLLVATEYTNAGSGSYCFMSMPPGEYVILEIQPDNYNSISDFDATTGAFDPDGVASADDPDDEIPVTLAPNELDADNNFIEDPFTGTISGFVLNDLNEGMTGITISLYADNNGDGNADGAVITDATTDTSGYYLFTNLEPGTYVVVESSPLYYFDISDYDQSTSPPDTDGDDSVDGADNNIPVVLAPGEDDEDNDFIDGRPGTICGNVSDTTSTPLSDVEIDLYQDVNNNDAYDAGDTLIATVLADNTTGNYCFENVTAGEYVLVEIQPANYNEVSDYDHSISASDPDGDDQADGADDEIPVSLAFGETDADNDFIDFPIPGDISGYVKNDADTAMESVKLYLYQDNNADGVEDGSPLDSVLTNASGYYQFTTLVPGHYVVVESQPLYYSSISDYDESTSPPDTDGDDSASGPDNKIPVNLMPAETDADNDFVDGRPGTICGSVHDDLNHPMSGMVIQLYDDVNTNGNVDPEDTLMVSTVTDGDSGSYCFEDMTPGAYILVEQQQPGYGNLSDFDATPDPDGDDSADGPDNNIPVILDPNESDVDNNFIDIICPGMPSIEGLPFDTICSGEAVSFTAVDPGVGSVNYTWAFGSGSAPSVGSNRGPLMVTYTSNPTNSTIGATVNLSISKAGCTTSTDSVAHVKVNPVPNATINAPITSLCYWAPRVFKPLAAYVPGYTYLWDFGAGAETPTAVGYGPHTVEYHTSGLKTVKLIVLSNAAGSNCSDTASITFNVIQCLGNITGKVRTVAGVGIPNVNIKLFPDNNLDGQPDGGDAIRNVNTSATGTYSMASLTPGQYVIVETQPAGYTSVMELDETDDQDTIVASNPNDNIIPVTVEPLEVDADNVFIESPTPGMISGSVFQDFDGDQAPDTGEGIDNVTISLFHDNDHNGIADPGGFISSVTTNSDGFYVFVNVVPANYVIVETQPDGFLSVMDIDPTNDGDVVPNTNTMNDTIPVTVSNAETDANNYFIELIACTNVVTNTNDDGYGSLRYVIGCAESGDTITFAPSLWNKTIHLNSSPITIDKDLYIHSSLTAPRIMIYSDIPGAFVIPVNRHVEMKNIEITSGLSGSLGAGIENYGNLTIWDVCVYRNILLPLSEHVIYNVNGAELKVVGSCHIQN